MARKVHEELNVKKKRVGFLKLISMSGYFNSYMIFNQVIVILM